MKLCLILLVTLGHLSLSIAAKQEKQPNFIFFLIDDLGFNDVGWHDSTISTPNLNQYASKGLTLEQNYVSPVCTPSRGQLMTGKYAFTLGLQHSVILFDSPDCAPLTAKYLPEALKDLGYQTHMLGKWHLGFCDWACTPTHRGFDTFYGYYQGMIDHFSHMAGGGYDWRDNEIAVTDNNGTHVTDLIRDRAIQLIQGFKKDEPFFMYVAWSAVHSPFAAPEKYVKPYRDAGLTEHVAQYRGLMTHLDDAFGQIMKALEDAGLDQNTIIGASGDNGGEYGASDNSPLRGAKATSFEGGVRTPGFVYSPGYMKKNVRGTVTNKLFSEVDWFPTFYAMAGGKVKSLGIDGVDQRGMLFNGMQSARDEIPLHIDSFSPSMFGAGALRVGDYKLIKGMAGLLDGYQGSLHFADPSFVAHTRMSYSFDYAAIMKFADNVKNNVQLYNIKNDPSETTDLAASMPKKVAELEARLKFWQSKEVTPDFAASNPDPAGSASNFGGVWTPGWCKMEK